MEWWERRRRNDSDSVCLGVLQCVTRSDSRAYAVSIIGSQTLSALCVTASLSPHSRNKGVGTHSCACWFSEARAAPALQRHYGN